MHSFIHSLFSRPVTYSQIPIREHVGKQVTWFLRPKARDEVLRYHWTVLKIVLKLIVAKVRMWSATNKHAQGRPS